MTTVPTTGPLGYIRAKLSSRLPSSLRSTRDLRWYVDTTVTNRKELQRYTAEKMFKALEPRYVDETTTKYGAYVLVEFGYLLCDDAAMSDGQPVRGTPHGVLAKAASNMNPERQ
ncbi:AP-2 complex subunit alpha-2 [Phytophthora pseudosyringae]|uniref:AP-2 complex subunit alpha-2 n=1 Tax=Phytophthora pseudosyringae TaxID=221518 RepID=A0A8T1V2J6_9STRA|nr:AP-2 complex subunit alpha-2 [Phytophthora pseudosyringae]